MAVSNGLEAEFIRCRDVWLAKTGHMALISEAAMEPEYQRIIGMGMPALPLIIETLRTTGGHWFWALVAITGEDHAGGATTVDEAADRWITWYDSTHAER